MAPNGVTGIIPDRVEGISKNRRAIDFARVGGHTRQPLTRRNRTRSGMAILLVCPAASNVEPEPNKNVMSGRPPSSFLLRPKANAPP